jgi:peptide/nickel transport system ATP-binding protein
MSPPLLQVRDLEVAFPTRRGRLVAVDGVSFDIAPGEVLGVVGESGAGKSMTGAAIIGLIEPPGHISGGEIRLDGQRIDNLPHEEMRKVRGRRIGMVFQDPLTSLNPLYTIGDQIIETIRTHFPIPRWKPGRAPSSFWAKWACRRRSGASTPIRTNSPAACASASCWRWRWPPRPSW